MRETFDAVAFPFSIAHEGGWDNDPHDRGNWTSGVIGKGELKGTKYGVASHVYPNLDIKNLTKEDARKIQWTDYALKVAYDALPAGFDVSVFDMAYNAGPARSLILAQRALGAGTSAPAQVATLANAATDKVALIKAFAAKRLSFYRGLSTFSRYGRGWSRRAAECEALSVKTWLDYGAKKPAAEIKKTLETEGKAANKASAGHAASGAAAGGAETANASQQDWAWQWDWAAAVEVGFAVVAVGLVLYFAWKALAHRDRANAYSNVAKDASPAAPATTGG